MERELFFMARTEEKPITAGRKTESERQRTLQRELEWIRMSPKGRHAKAKARINPYESLLNQDIEKGQRLGIYIPPGPRLGSVVIDADNVSKAYGDNILMEGMTFSLPPGELSALSGRTEQERQLSSG